MNNMAEEEVVNSIRKNVLHRAWEEASTALARRLESEMQGYKPVSVLAQGCLTFSRVDATSLFYLSSGVWANFSLRQWRELVCTVSPRPVPTWAWDGGQFADIVFLLTHLRMNGFLLAAQAPMANDVDVERILTFGELNSEWLLPADTEPSTLQEPEEGDDYDLLFAHRAALARSNVVSLSPELAIQGANDFDLLRVISVARQQR